MEPKNLELPPIVEQRRRFLRNALAATTAATSMPAMAFAASENETTIDDIDAITAHVDPYINITDAPYNADPTGATNCTTALTTALAAGADLLIPPGTYLISANFTIPSGKRLSFSAGAKFNVSLGVTLTIRGEVIAPRNVQLFSGLGSVLGIRQVYPEWWGAKGDGVTDDLSAMNSAHSCVINSAISDGGTPTIFLSRRSYAISNSWVLTPKTSLAFRVIGAGPTNTKIVTMAAFPAAPVVRILGVTIAESNGNWEFGNLQISAGSGGIGGALTGLLVGSYNTSLYINGYQDSLVDNITIIGFPTCLEQCEARQVKYERCCFFTQGMTSTNYPVKITESGRFTGDITFSDCQFAGEQSLTPAGMLIQAANGGVVAGIRLRGVIGYRSEKFVHMYATNGTIGDIWIDGGTQFDAYNVNGIVIQASTSAGSISDIHLDNVYVTSSSSDMVVIESFGSGSSFGWIQSISINNCWFAIGSAGGIFIDNHGGTTIQGVSISNNTFWSFLGSGIPAIRFNAKAINCIGNVATGWASGRFNYFIQINSNSTYFVVTGNNSGGLATASPWVDLTGAVPKVISNNI